jgi:hypothetical protein
VVSGAREREREGERGFRLLFNRRSYSLSVAWRNNFGSLSRFTIKSKRTLLCQTISPLSSPSLKHDLYIVLPTPRPQRAFLVSSYFNMVGKIPSSEHRFIPPMLANIAAISVEQWFQSGHLCSYHNTEDLYYINRLPQPGSFSQCF